MEQWRWIQNDHINAFGILHGGHMLKWVDEDTTMAAFNCCAPGTLLTTAGFDRTSFVAPSIRGDRLRFVYSVAHIGTSSITFLAHVYRHPIDSGQKPQLAFRSLTTLVCINENNHPAPIKDKLLSGIKVDTTMSQWVDELRKQRKSDPTNW